MAQLVPAPLIRRGVVVALWLLAPAARATEQVESTAPAPESKALPVEVHAGAREEYRLRYSPDPDQSSQDLRLGLDASVADASGHYLGAANLGLFWTVRRAIQTGTSDGMSTVLDAKNPFFDVYQLLGEYRSAGVLRVARLGRQTADHGRPATFDGAALEVRPLSALSLFAFGGRSEHFFEVPQTGATVWDDWLASVGAGYRPHQSFRFEVDYRLLAEKARDPSGALARVMDHSYGLTAWWRPADAAWAKLGLRGLNAKFAEVLLSGHVFFTAPALGLDARVKVQPVTLNELDELENPFYLTLGPSLPHARWNLDLSRVFPVKGGAFEAHLGWNGRHLLKDPESAFNRNTSDLSLMAAVRDLGLVGLSAQVSLERLTDSAIPLTGRGIFTVNGSAAYQRGMVRGEAGVQYYRYQYNYYRDVEELTDVRVVFAEVRLKPLAWLQVRALYQLELYDRTRQSFTVTVGQTY